MPVYYGYNQELKARNDKLAAENDVLREEIIKLVTNPAHAIEQELWLKIQRAQSVHRQEDLDRLEEVFIESKDAKKLNKVWKADPNLPLEPQLGFNPDDY